MIQKKIDPFIIISPSAVVVFVLSQSFFMTIFHKLLELAAKRTFYRTLLNWVLLHRIPFNKPHGLKISRVLPAGFEVILPYRRKNWNHLKGIHACALATASEYVAGLTLIRFLDPKKYRLILESLQTRYIYQAKSAVSCRLELDERFVRQEILEPLLTQDSVFVDMKTQITDENDQLICETTTRWQIKSWEKVKTKV